MSRSLGLTSVSFSTRYVSHGEFNYRGSFESRLSLAFIVGSMFSDDWPAMPLPSIVPIKHKGMVELIVPVCHCERDMSCELDE